MEGLGTFAGTEAENARRRMRLLVGEEIMMVVLDTFPNISVRSTANSSHLN
jgi:hypothetical protein